MTQDLDTLIHRLNHDLDFVASLAGPQTVREHQLAAQLLALNDFVNAFEISKEILETEEHIMLRVTESRMDVFPNPTLRLTFRLDADLLRVLSELPSSKPLLSQKEVLEQIAQVWGPSECGYLRNGDEVVFAVNAPELGVVLHARYLLQWQDKDSSAAGARGRRAH